MLDKGQENAQILEARNLHKAFGAGSRRVEILKGIDIALDRGETIAIVGASGVGKSTLLHLLGALERPDQGEIFYQGKEVGNLTDDDLAVVRNKYVGFVFQFHHLLPEFSALENVMMPALIARMENQKARSLAGGILDSVGLGKRLDHKIGMLSGGEQQRVALARALVLSPKLLLADEPTGNLDMQTGRKVHELMLYLSRENKMGTIIVTHNMDLAGSTDRRLTMVDGRIFSDISN